MVNKKFLAFMFMFMFVISFASAVKPVPTIFSADTGLRLEVLAPSNIPVSTEVNVTVHIFNASNGYIFNASEGFECEGILINQVGTIIKEQAAGVIDNYAYFTLGDSDATTSGEYQYVMYCNNSNQGGFYKNYFNVGYSREELTTGKSIIYIGLLALVAFLFIINGVCISMLPKANNKIEDGRIMSINYLKYLNLPLLYIQYFLLIAITYMAANISFVYLASAQLFANFFFVIYRILFSLTPLVTIIWVISFFIIFWNDKQTKSILSNGIFPTRI